MDEPVGPSSPPPEAPAVPLTGGYAAADAPVPLAPAVPLAARVPDIPTLAAREEIAAAVECPGCGAKLRNVQADAGVKIRCLNCGARFSPFPQQADAAAAGIALLESVDEK